MDSSADQSPTFTPCPLGQDACPIIEQVTELHRQVSLLKEQVRTDHLTGLFNSRHMFYSLEQEIERSQRSGHQTTLVILDVDYFKNFNDCYGHVVGDAVLKHLASIILSCVRRLDIPCRYGGEEFAIILPSTPLMIGVQVANRLRQEVEKLPLLWRGQSLPVTISLGVDCFDQNAKDTPQQFIERADKQLYLAKDAGRNCVHYADIKSRDVKVTEDEKAALFNLEFNQEDETPK